ncbi:MAG: MBL fold metallo-hydrolase [Candidatus Saccharimonadales bacterium]
MELKYRGGNCIEIAVKKDTFIVDGKLSSVGLKDITDKDAVYLATQPSFNAATEGSIVIDSPGEFEVRGVSVKGIAARRMIDSEGAKNTTIYALVVDGVRIVVVGHVHQPLTEDELEAIGLVDMAIVPVGGNGYTLDAHQAMKIVKQLEPKVVVPTHYQDEAIHYEVPQNSLEEFIKEMSAEHEIVTSYKVKGGVLPATLTLVEISRS